MIAQVSLRATSSSVIGREKARLESQVGSCLGMGYSIPVIHWDGNERVRKHCWIMRWSVWSPAGGRSWRVAASMPEMPGARRGNSRMKSERMPSVGGSMRES